jgi:hypothetical protein
MMHLYEGPQMKMLTKSNQNEVLVLQSDENMLNVTEKVSGILFHNRDSLVWTYTVYNCITDIQKML